jgi:hypothetical protein
MCLDLKPIQVLPKYLHLLFTTLHLYTTFATQTPFTSPCEARSIWDETFSALLLHKQTHMIHYDDNDV